MELQSDEIKEFPADDIHSMEQIMKVSAPNKGVGREAQVLKLGEDQKPMKID